MDRIARGIAIAVAMMVVIVAWSGRQSPTHLDSASALPDSVADSTHQLLDFGAPVADARVLTLLRKHELRPVTLYVYTDGLWATHRVALASSSVDEVGKARNIIANMMRGGLRGAQQRATLHFTAGRAGTAAAAATRKRSFLTVIEREKAVIRSATSGRPLIYAAEVVGTGAALAAAGADPMVRARRQAWRTGGRVRTARPARPAGSDRAYHSVEIDALTDSDADQRIADLARSGVKEIP